MSRPVLIGYDGSPSAGHAVHEAAALLTVRRALIVTVWEAGAAYATLEGPGIPAAPIDLGAAAEADQAMLESVRHTAERGARLATLAGFEAEALTVADEHSIGQTLCHLAREHDARAIVVGAHGHNRLEALFMGSTTRQVLEGADRAVLVVRPPD